MDFNFIFTVVPNVKGVAFDRALHKKLQKNHLSEQLEMVFYADELPGLLDEQIDNQVS